MSSYGALYEFTEEGMNAFRRVMAEGLDETTLDLANPLIAARIAGTTSFDARRFATSKEMAQAIISAAGQASVGDLLTREGLWAWLSFVMRDQLYSRMADGRRRLGEVHKWYPAPLNDFQKGQRHLVRTPVLLLSRLGRNADHLLCGDPAVAGELREQLTSQQDMFHPAFQEVARTLYYDEQTGKLRRGAGGKGRGSSRRLAAVRLQLDVTWDLFAITPSELLEKLPEEFENFRRHSVNHGDPAATSAAARESDSSLQPAAQGV